MPLPNSAPIAQSYILSLTSNEYFASQIKKMNDPAYQHVSRLRIMNVTFTPVLLELLLKVLNQSQQITQVSFENCQFDSSIMPILTKDNFSTEKLFASHFYYTFAHACVSTSEYFHQKYITSTDTPSKRIGLLHLSEVYKNESIRIGSIPLTKMLEASYKKATDFIITQDWVNGRAHLLKAYEAAENLCRIHPTDESYRKLLELNAEIIELSLCLKDHPTAASRIKANIILYPSLVSPTFRDIDQHNHMLSLEKIVRKEIQTTWLAKSKLNHSTMLWQSPLSILNLTSTKLRTDQSLSLESPSVVLRK